MTNSTKTWRKSLRTLQPAELAAVSGGISFLGAEERSIIIYGSTSVGDGLSTSFTGGVLEALPAVQR